MVVPVVAPVPVVVPAPVVVFPVPVVVPVPVPVPPPAPPVPLSVHPEPAAIAAKSPPITTIEVTRIAVPLCYRNPGVHLGPA